MSALFAGPSNELPAFAIFPGARKTSSGVTPSDFRPRFYRNLVQVIRRHLLDAACIVSALESAASAFTSCRHRLGRSIVQPR